MTTALVILVLLAVAGWVGWGFLSRRALLPCPAAFSFVVERDNPLAKFTRAAHVVERLAPKPGETIADIGCGPGRVTLPLARAVAPGGEILAIDVQPAMLAKLEAKAAREGVENIRRLATDLRQAKLEPNSLDGAVMVMALGEIPDNAAVLPALYAALKPGGRLVIAESTFDPHYVAIRRLRDMADAAGFSDRRCFGNLFGYSLLLEKPAATRSAELPEPGPGPAAA
ncbi:putative methyltransferase [Rhodovulum sp. PH10]|uniref:class I SAM-dependent methyltransferase n=1 Tax=Rhodovulum sp. PH10 TaxID=1187851 RepID=UPI00027C1F8B|nr:methyltransferase domain-containing protein [Rhodovulum sp. PH10]EJW13516.1 putative methyltransferase [Rhodovulum sp. PH10]